MEARIKELLEKIKYPKEKFSCFENATFKKIVVEEEKNTWNIHIKNKTNFIYEDISVFLKCLNEYVSHKYKYNIFVKVEEEDLSLFEDYYKQILILINNNNLYYNMFCDRLIKEDDKFFVEVYNKSEEITLKRKLDTINKYFKNFGFKTTLKSKLNKEKESTIKEEIEKDMVIDESKIKSFSNASRNIKEKLDKYKIDKKQIIIVTLIIAVAIIFVPVYFYVLADDSDADKIEIITLIHSTTSILFNSP